MATQENIRKIEAAHGFTFGGGEKPTSDPVQIAVCVTPGCAAQNSHVKIYADTVLPVHCGSCASVLVADSDAVVTTDASTILDKLDPETLAQIVALVAKSRASK